VRSRLFASALAAWAALAFAPAPAPADQPGLQISVEPLVVQFALAPGGQAATPVTIRNTGTQKALVVANAIDWRTTVDGSVKTERPGSQASSLGAQLRLSGESEFVLAPGETRRLTLSLVLPATFPGAPRDYWSGYFVRATPAGTPSAQSFGVGANILAYETVGAPARHVKLTDLQVDGGAGRGAQLTARLRNDGRTFVRPQIRMLVAQAGRIVQQREDSTPAIFSGERRLYTRALNDLPPGTYQLQLTIDYGGETLVEGTTDFTLR
jgi:hypothetical protein